MSNALLNVNIDHVATIRNLRNLSFPDPIQAAFVAEQSGADGITVHLREDRRHIRERDLLLLKEIIQKKINLEISTKPEMISLACDLLPHSCCLVPEKRDEMTTERGLDVVKKKRELFKIVEKLKKNKIQVSLFVDTNDFQIEAASEIGVSHIEIHTGPYSRITNSTDLVYELKKIRESIEYATSLGLKVNAGHGLNYFNVRPIAKIDKIEELNIGHSIISRSVIVGLEKAVRDMKKLIQEA